MVMVAFAYFSLAPKGSNDLIILRVVLAFRLMKLLENQLNIVP